MTRASCVSVSCPAPAPTALLGAELHLSQLSFFRGPAHFSGITLTLFPDGGNAFPEPAAPVVVAPDDQNLFAIDCANAPANQVSCAAKTEIITYFLKAGGRNAKSTAVGGMTAGSPPATGDIGIAGVKVLTSLSPAPVPPILGGAEFDLPVSSPDPATIQHQGCPQWPSMPASCDNLTPEEIAYNTFTVFFNGTLFGRSWGGAHGTQPIQFVEIDYTDVLFAERESCPTPPNTIPGNPSLQDLLSEASNDLYAIAGEPTAPFTRSCP